MATESTAVGWQMSPGRRGTLTIIENCVFTIIACTWSIQHLNIPGLGESRWRTLLRKCKWTVFTLFFPEFLMAHAILEFVMAIEGMRLLDKEWRLGDNPPWFYRYLRRSPKSYNDMEGRHATQSAEKQDVKWTITHCYFANMGGFYIRYPTGPDSPSKNNLLAANNFIKYWTRIGIPDLAEEDLTDKSETDFFTKALAVLQITQLILSLIVRKVQHLDFSQLEALTLAFAICGALTYVCSWYKPQNVKRPIQVFLRPDQEFPREIQRRPFDSLWEILSNSDLLDGKEALERIPNDNIPKAKPHETHYALYVLTALTAGFGSIHAVAWNFEFPTFIERLLWRVATVVSTVLPPATLLVIPLAQILVPWGDNGDFRDTCLAAMREYSWHTADNQHVQTAMKTLQKICDNPESNGHEHYRDILGDGIDGQGFLGEKILEHIEQNEIFQECTSKNFPLQFRQLVEILRGSSPKRLWDTALTNTYPQRSIFDTLVNDWVIYVTSILYCLARLSIVGIAFSSLRLMPDSVYTIPWTAYIPSVQ
ncbi:hypothetical protein NUW58_g7325 [Xylaria curta]|uniref:Uncharacterized protein n=1 Tax=Xylaria curta TaxID=42375 RepID=A0ACC1NKU7_9PEZI|nr:hypothetical protein NUW58_g7325 [Xylaria curta]